MAVPSEPPKLLPGRSAQYWTRRGGVSLAVGAISVAVVPFAAGWPGAIQIVLVAVIAVACVVGFVSFVLSGSATASEYAAGYSTLTGRAYRHLWQLDAKTGAVVRPPDPPEPD